MIRINVKLDLEGLRKFRYEIDKPQGPIRDAIRQWAHRYRAFIQRRYRNYSRGGGDWPPLKRARKRGSLGRASILIDTGTLFRAVDPVFRGQGGALQQDLPLGIRVGFGGPARHPKGRATIADIARFHNAGEGHLPQRQIIVAPPQVVRNAMAGDMQRALKKLADGTIDK